MIAEHNNVVLRQHNIYYYWRAFSKELFFYEISLIFKLYLTSWEKKFLNSNDSSKFRQYGRSVCTRVSEHVKCTYIDIILYNIDDMVNWSSVRVLIFQHGHPYVSAMVNNGTLHYDHDRDGTHTELAGCESFIRGTDFHTYVSIRYEKSTLTVCISALYCYLCYSLVVIHFVFCIWWVVITMSSYNSIYNFHIVSFHSV